MKLSVDGFRPAFSRESGVANSEALAPGQWSTFGVWVATTLVLGAVFFCWWLHLRPGVFSFDSGFYIQEVISGQINSRKPFLYARFIQLTSLGGTAVHLAVIVQVGLVTIALSRIFALGIWHRATWPTLALAAVVVLNPYVANMTLYLQNDVLFCVAILVLLAETLHIAKCRRVGLGSAIIIGLFAPMAMGFRENGLLFMPFWLLVVVLTLDRPAAIRVALVALLSTLVAYASIIGVNRADRHELLYPAIIHETVRLAQPGFRYQQVGDRLSPETVNAVGLDNLQKAVAFYWPLYWDSIAFFPDGPKLLELEPARRQEIVRQFLRHDLLPNLPSIAAHRIEMFTGALLARAEAVDSYGVPANLPPQLASWKQARSEQVRGEGILGKVNAKSFDYRSWTWNAAFGLTILMWLSARALWARDRTALGVLALVWIQAGVVLVVAPSAEYRYVFLVYLAPMLAMLIPVTRTDASVKISAPQDGAN